MLSWNLPKIGKLKRPCPKRFILEEGWGWTEHKNGPHTLTEAVSMLLWNHTILHRAHSSPLSFCKHHDWNSPHMSWLSTYWFFSREMWFRCAPFLKSCLPQLLKSPSVVLCARDGFYERRFHFKKEFRSTTATWLLSSRSCPMIRVKKCRNFANYFLALRPRVNSFARMTIKTLIFVRFVKQIFSIL